MQPNEKAIIDAKREGFIRGREEGESRGLTYTALAARAERVYPYPKVKRRREVRTRTGMYRVNDAGDGFVFRIGDSQCWNPSSWHGEEISALASLLDNPDEEVDA